MNQKSEIQLTAMADAVLGLLKPFAETLTREDILELVAKKPNAKDAGRELMSVAEAARYVKRTPKTIHNWLRAGLIRASKIQNTVLIYKDSLDGLIEASPYLHDIRGEKKETSEMA